VTSHHESREEGAPIRRALQILKLSHPSDVNLAG